MEEELIAPCGMNCVVCAGYLARKHEVRSKGIRMAYCVGCRPRDKQCALLLSHQVRCCYECDSFPCANLVKLDKKYRANFRMSPIENLESIKHGGVERFLEGGVREVEVPRVRRGGLLPQRHLFQLRPREATASSQQVPLGGESIGWRP